jgi:hypothetical protein
LRPIGSMAGSRPVEAWLHLVFADDRDNGEWFRSTSRLRAFIALLPLVPIIELKPQLKYERRERPMTALIAESEPEPEPDNADLPGEFICRRCGHQWTRRKPGRPAQCPNCKQTRWDTPSKWADPQPQPKVVIEKNLDAAALGRRGGNARALKAMRPSLSSSRSIW